MQLTKEQLQELKDTQAELEQAKNPRHWELLDQLTQYYEDNGLNEYWESKVIEEGLCHYDDVDSMGEIAFQLWLEE